MCDCCDGSDEIGFLGYSSTTEHSSGTFSEHSSGTFSEHSSGTFFRQSGVLTHCENTCETDLINLRQNAIIWHRNLQNGLKVKRELIGANVLKKKTESKYVQYVRLNYYGCLFRVFCCMCQFMCICQLRHLFLLTYS